ncbi:34533_t:CDS:1 [Gigaspora margarita]|uniref:34533_t:CDS:1 n=1 Tax=Gigaspora margarita TaxID=4874 RepID=A0ABN7UPF8_GIGMA|nr:34533_t:CDS:1 [Gigaspora margarita]
MFQPNRSQRSRTNATQACTNCQIRHQRCEKPSEGDINGTCTNCKNDHLHCENTPPKKRGRKPRSPGIIETPYSCETVVSFIGQGQMPDDQITASINYHEPFFRTTEVLINQEPTPITASINTYETAITNLGTSYTYNHIATIPSFRAIDAFTGQGQTQADQNTAPIDPYETFFETTGTLIGHEQTSNHSIAALPFFRTSDTFIGQGQTLDDQSTLINSYESFFGELIGQESTQKHQNITPINIYETTSNFGTSYAYNNITTFPSFGTIDAFTGQVQTLDDQNTVLINSYESFFGAIREFIAQ